MWRNHAKDRRIAELVKECDKLRSQLHAAHPPVVEQDIERLELIQRLNAAKEYIARLESIEKKLPSVLDGIVADIIAEVGTLFDDARTHERKVYVVSRQVPEVVTIPPTTYTVDSTSGDTHG